MVDVVDTATRSRMMSGIRGRNTKPEKLIRSLLHRRGFRFRLNVLLHRRAVVFVHGCFWHGHNCALFKWPQTRPEFWREKIARNRLNDAKALAALAAQGWRVAVIWECALRGAQHDPQAVVERLAAWLEDESSTWFEARS
ncbi:very short patch repair endonuclease [Paraburkholderia sp. BR10879]|uniref:very short patch repair endonuclease n=1 Tax=Paraburkholderia sp. BR10879 TaxID=3236990 RepID=UPI00397DC304